MNNFEQIRVATWVEKVDIDSCFSL
jgi:hypothetical protein